MANGTITVFNVYSQDLTLSLNGADAIGVPKGPIPGWTGKTGELKYQPHGTTVDRVLNKNESKGKFWGPLDNKPRDNSLRLDWGSDGTYYATIQIGKSLNADLILFLTREEWWLVNVDDGTLSTPKGFGPVTSDETVKALLESVKK